ncbi:MAG: serine/threonine protein kinase, partial [Thermoguttaceae bacterium]
MMPTSVPREIIELLDRLGLAEGQILRAAESRVRRLGRELPQFQSVWIDALLQDQRLTPYQAAELKAGRGPALRLGPWVLEGKLSSLGYAHRLAARRVHGGSRAELVVIDRSSESCGEGQLGRLSGLVSRAGDLTAEGLVPLVECGEDGGRIWAALRREAGSTAADHLVRHGRMPPAVVVEIARQMAAALIHLERAGLAHGDVSARSLVLGDKGRALLLAPGLRPMVREAEGFAHIDLAPEYYDSLAPEQIDGGVPADTLTDLYGCGCLWWHLLTGRACFSGGDSLGKLRAHLSEEPAEVRRLAPDTPEDLAGLIGACLASDRRQRPRTASGRAEVARWVRPSSGAPPVHVPSPRRPFRLPAGWPLAAAGAALVALIALLWGMGLPQRPASVDRARTAPVPGTGLPSGEARSGGATPAPSSPSLPSPADQAAGGPGALVLPAEGPVSLDGRELSEG